MIDRLVFDKEFKEKLNAVNEAAYKYFKIKAEYDKASEKLHLLLDEQKENNTGECTWTKGQGQLYQKLVEK